MYVKRWVAFVAIFVAACLPAYGNNSGSAPQDLLARPDDTVFGSAPALKLDGCVLFRSTLQDAWRNSTGMPTARWDGSEPTEIPREQGRIATLPEPGSGVLLVIGLAGLLYLGRTGELIHENSPRIAAGKRNKITPQLRFYATAVADIMVSSRVFVSRAPVCRNTSRAQRVFALSAQDT